MNSLRRAIAPSDVSRDVQEEIKLASDPLKPSALYMAMAMFPGVDVLVVTPKRTRSTAATVTKRSRTKFNQR